MKDAEWRQQQRERGLSEQEIDALVFGMLFTVLWRRFWWVPVALLLVSIALNIWF